jgi:hypothetical protein
MTEIDWRDLVPQTKSDMNGAEVLLEQLEGKE